MEEHKNLYKTITETVPEFFFVYNLLQKSITFVSPRFYELAQGAAQNSHNQMFISYIHPEDQPLLEQFFSDLSVENNYTNRIELRTRENLADVRWVELITFPVEQESKPEADMVVGHFTNITQKKELIEVMEQEHEKLDSLIKILAHDLRAPFSQVYMIADILKNTMSEQEQEQYGMYIGMLKTLGNRSLTLLDNLLRLVALQEEAISLDLKMQDLRKVLSAVMESFKLDIEQKGINVQLELPDFAMVAEVDQVLLEQAFSNLLSNALKFTHEGGDVFIRMKQEDDKAYIEVQDTGIGIPESHLPELFKEFSKIRRKGLKGEKSTGLGLAICRQILRLHGGEITLETKEQQGTTFRIILPIH